MTATRRRRHIRAEGIGATAAADTRPPAVAKYLKQGKSSKRRRSDHLYTFDGRYRPWQGKEGQVYLAKALGFAEGREPCSADLRAAKQWRDNSEDSFEDSKAHTSHDRVRGWRCPAIEGWHKEYVRPCAYPRTWKVRIGDRGQAYRDMCQAGLIAVWVKLILQCALRPIRDAADLSALPSCHPGSPAKHPRWSQEQPVAGREIDDEGVRAAVRSAIEKWRNSARSRGRREVTNWDFDYQDSEAEAAEDLKTEGGEDGWQQPRGFGFGARDAFEQLEAMSCGSQDPAAASPREPNDSTGTELDERIVGQPLAEVLAEEREAEQAIVEREKKESDSSQVPLWAQLRDVSSGYSIKVAGRDMLDTAFYLHDSGYLPGRAVWEPSIIEKLRAIAERARGTKRALAQSYLDDPSTKQTARAAKLGVHIATISRLKAEIADAVGPGSATAEQERRWARAPFRLPPRTGLPFVSQTIKLLSIRSDEKHLDELRRRRSSSANMWGTVVPGKEFTGRRLSKREPARTIEQKHKKLGSIYAGPGKVPTRPMAWASDSDSPAMRGRRWEMWTHGLESR